LARARSGVGKPLLMPPADSTRSRALLALQLQQQPSLGIDALPTLPLSDQAATSSSTRTAGLAPTAAQGIVALRPRKVRHNHAPEQPLTMPGPASLAQQASLNSNEPVDGFAWLAEKARVAARNEACRADLWAADAARRAARRASPSGAALARWAVQADMLASTVWLSWGEVAALGAVLAGAVVVMAAAARSLAAALALSPQLT
jgi:hypothetical protein